MRDDELAILGGTPVRTRSWPKWPRADHSTLQAVREVLDSSRWAVSGPYDGRECFERRLSRAFADFHGVDYCTPTTSGTTALTIALQALGIGRGDEVLVPGLTWVACASAAVNVGAVPVLVDIDPQTLAMDARQARAACSRRLLAPPARPVRPRSSSSTPTAASPAWTRSPCCPPNSASL
jgi:L-glutamine:scyllo-inosose aminotransferase/L-glutamine:2-deoxy-scyllo-inosose/3-amino-2,3-dideoxy-scyllo-inosose aminotransferase